MCHHLVAYLTTIVARLYVSAMGGLYRIKCWTGELTIRIIFQVKKHFPTLFFLFYYIRSRLLGRFSSEAIVHDNIIHTTIEPIYTSALPAIS
jgi:hypothetical protein